MMKNKTVRHWCVAHHDVEALNAVAERLQGEGRTVVFVALDGGFAGLLVVADPIKDSTPEAIETLRSLGLRVFMLTGDNEQTARVMVDKTEYRPGLCGCQPTR